MQSMTNRLSQQGIQQAFDVIVIGSGVAGLSYVASLSALRPNTRIALISKTTCTESNSYYAQGGIALSEADDQQSHINDTIAAGDQLCHVEHVKQIIEQCPQVLQQLQQLKINFTLDQHGKLAKTREGGHQTARIVFNGDATGRAMIDAYLQHIHTLKNVSIFDQHTAVNLITQQHVQPGYSPQVLGCYVLNNQSKKIDTFSANVVVLACGGAGKVYRYTTNPATATGDGVAMAYRAGARINHMEFYQFHPTLLYHDQVNNFLISETLRGEGAILRRADTGQPFMQHYSPAAELATRDVVARAIFSEIERGDNNYVYLDITHHSRNTLQQRFPTIFQQLLSLGIDISQDYIPVVPAAHYQCGGVVADTSGRTDVSRLFAIGEVAATGLHGANRLASNSLLEGIAMAINAAQASVSLCDSQNNTTEQLPLWNSASVTDLRRASQINSHWRGLRGEMTSYAGIVRTEAGLQDLLNLISIRRDIIEDYYWRHQITRDVIELRNIVLTAELITRAALNRRESRGGHFREDYQEKLSCLNTVSC